MKKYIKIFRLKNVEKKLINILEKFFFLFVVELVWTGPRQCLEDLNLTSSFEYFTFQDLIFLEVEPQDTGTEYRIYGIQGTGYTGYRLQDTGYRIQDTGYRIQDTGYFCRQERQKTEYRTKYTGYRILRIQNIGYKI